ncbi:MAG: hypothetical protein H3C63_03970, partial [Candidatus Omnitrophica bacterium]|nr:hypothetical protein [Candidatus Omnitrophota bacterium]
MVGNGDGLIHVIPMISKPSVKNGEKITISAIVKAQAGVARVEADMGGIEWVELQPSARQGGVNAGGTMGHFTAEWTGHDLEEKVYTLSLKVTDKSGHVFTDQSLTFSDPAAGNSNVGTPDYPSEFMKRIGAASGGIIEPNLLSSVIDAANGYAYFGTGASPGRVVKVALGNGNNPPTRVASLTLDSGEDSLVSAVIDAEAGYAYFGTATSPAGIVVKVALGAGSNPPTRVGAVALDSGEENLASAVIDPGAGYAYFGTYTTPGMVVKVALGSGSNPPSRVDAVTLDSGEDSLVSAV